jgi:hypothetical protein
LADLGVERIVVAADHGYIFGDELDAGMLLPAPGGQTVDLHRRVWIGRGGQAHENVLRVPAESVGLGSNLELATPLGFAGFAAGGNKTYMHGGLTLQELIIPVLTILPVAVPEPLTAQIDWMLTPGSPKLVTRFLSVTISGKASGMFELVPPRVRVEIQSKAKVLSTSVGATYGFSEATGEIELRARESNEIEPNTISLFVHTEFEAKTVSILLLNAETEQTLKKIEIPAAISIG